MHSQPTKKESMLGSSIFSLFFILPGAFGSSQTKYVLKWKIEDKLPLEARVVQAADYLGSRVGETGEATNNSNLPVISQMDDGSVTLVPEKEAILILFIKNSGKSKIRFSVAPHTTEPGSASLGFAFNCLCNGHVYEVEPDKIWYRVMSLRARAVPTGQNQVVLEHTIFKVREKK